MKMLNAIEKTCAVIGAITIVCLVAGAAETAGCANERRSVMKQDELNAILDKHTKWLRGEDGGNRADLSGADLRDANLCGANLRGANLCGADLRCLCRPALCQPARCQPANLCDADLRGADLRCLCCCRPARCPDLCDLSCADLCGASPARC
jgi:uncharacterized protein YjbI with pentapeptide repeats